MRGINLGEARAAKRIKSLNKQIATQRRQITRMDRARRQAPGRNHVIEEYFPRAPPRVFPENNQIFNEIARNMTVAPNRWRFSAYFQAFALLLLCVSLPAYTLLRRVLPFPSRQSIMATFKEDYWYRNDIITNLSQLKIALQEYCAESDANGPDKMIRGILAVDAISLKPHLRIDRHGFVEGTTTNEQIPRDLLENITASYRSYEQFVKNRTNVTITDSFVYQFQPFNASIRCIVVYVEPSNTGKATLREIDRLTALKDGLQDCNLSVQGFAFDGDSTYSRLHEEFFNTYYTRLVHDYQLSYEDIQGPVTVSDPLHLLKRARYRLLSKSVDASTCGDERLLKLEAMKELFDVPAIVWTDKPYTKMHDSLAVRLFTLDNLVKLIDSNMINELSYFLPMTLMNSALKEEHLSPEERFGFLEIGLLYMVSYLGVIEHSKCSLRPQRAPRNSTVRLFTDIFIVEYCNTAMSLLKAMSTESGPLGLNRIGSNPVEHLFGLVRMKSRDSHTFQKLKKTLGKIELHRQMKDDFGIGASVNKRESYYAKTIQNSPPTTKSGLHVESRDAVVAVAKEFGFPISLDELVPWDFQTVFELSSEITQCLFRNLKIITKRIRSIQPQAVTSSSACTVTGSPILSRICTKKIIE